MAGVVQCRLCKKSMAGSRSRHERFCEGTVGTAEELMDWSQDMLQSVKAKAKVAGPAVFPSAPVVNEDVEDEALPYDHESDPDEPELQEYENGIAYADDRPPSPPADDDHGDTVGRDLRSTLNFLLLFIVGWSACFRIPETAVNALLSAVGRVLVWLLEEDSNHRSLLISQWPNNMGQMMKPCGIDTNTFEQYAMCPNKHCGAIYLIDELRRQPIKTCTRRRSDMLGVDPLAEHEEGKIEDRGAKEPELEDEVIDEHAHLDAADFNGDRIEAKRSRRQTSHYVPSAAAAIPTALVEGDVCGATLLRRANRTGKIYEPITIEPKSRDKPIEPSTEQKSTSKSKKPPPLSQQPILAYQYHGLTRPLQLLLSHPGVEEKCEEWRERYKIIHDKAHRFNQYPDERAGAKDKTFVMRQHDNPLFVLSDLPDGEQWERYLYVSKTTQRPWSEQIINAAKLREGYSDFLQRSDEESTRLKIILNEAEAAVAALSMDMDMDSDEDEEKKVEIDEEKLGHKRKSRATVAAAAAAAAAAAIIPPERIALQEAQEAMDKFQEEFAIARVENDIAIARPMFEADISKNLDCEALLAAPGTLALGFNVDWLQPSKNNAYSMGAMYMTLLNLPREDRYRKENMISIGVLPGPKQTSVPQLQSALQPLIDELQEFFSGNDGKGKFLHTAAFPHGRYVRAFLLCAICDLPAARDLGGFASCSALQGCAYCSQSLTMRKDKSYVDYSLSGTGPRDTWTPRTDAQHRQFAHQWAKCKSTAKRNEHMKKHGSRLSALMQLKYFDMIRGIPIDVMHNIYLGTCKRLTQLCTISQKGATPLLGKSELTHLQSFMDSLACPPDVGRIPIRLAQGFSSFKASEWNNWMCMFAVPSLRDMIRKFPDSRFKVHHLQLFITLSEIAIIMRSYVTSYSQIAHVDQLILKLLQDMETVFGESAIAPNQHLSAHLAPMLRDYGPPAGWWCNAYERMNGLLSNQPHSRSYLPLCTMRRILLLIGVSHSIRRRVTLRQRRILGTGPTRKDYASILTMMFGSQEETADILLNGLPAEAVAEAFEVETYEIQQERRENEIEADPGRRRRKKAVEPSFDDSHKSIYDSNHRNLLDGLYNIPEGDSWLRRYCRTTASGRKQAVYKWGGESRSELFRAWMAMQMDRFIVPRVTGAEPFPGELLHHGRGVTSVWGDLIEKEEAYWNIFHPFKGATKKKITVRPSLYIPADLRNGLLSHYIEAYDTIFIQNASTPALAQQMTDAKDDFANNQTIPNKCAKFQAFLHNFSDKEQRIEMFDSLEILGEQYGSVAGTNHRSSFVRVGFIRATIDKRRSKDKFVVEPYFGQVKFFFRHTLHIRDKHGQVKHTYLHHFAYLHYYTATKGSALGEQSQVRDELTHLQKEGLDSLRRSEDLHHFPILKSTPDDKTLFDAVPIHRLCGRWIPACIDEGSWQACPIPLKTHA